MRNRAAVVDSTWMSPSNTAVAPVGTMQPVGTSTSGPCAGGNMLRGYSVGCDDGGGSVGGTVSPGGTVAPAFDGTSSAAARTSAAPPTTTTRRVRTDER
jgi:hypothetical protein